MAPTGSALTSRILAQFNHAVERSAGQALPAPVDIEGYVYVGYFKDSRAEEEFPTVEAKPVEELEVETLNATPSPQVPENYVYEEVLTAVEDIPFGKIREYSTAFLEGIEKITQEGKNGQRKVTVKNTYVDGKLVKSEPIASEVVLAPVEEVTTIGKKAVTEILSNIVDLLSLPITEQVLSTMEPVEFETQKEVL
ncbi:TPA: G5 domain-containing protein [Streptococcus suis]|uniref:Putative IgA-specific zinc metalloproteinase n=2 Tax=Streptococcus suis TaxID=1307 RepID=A0A0Z8IEP0_STRSU|nr:hypothetical protein [Streptococcus suis]HEM3199060.1 G5 domain-containing protein [Streptococcus suis 14A]NQG59662.1 hypothetical protein [Streptococcus suis]NQH18532.1 hypothetical protein [Streptococcus suis]NQL54484.1 hypothetical protein [Streptococcus suis]